ncbi:MAG: DNA translocase FtsK 4TM domain-containing protein [Candidatus Saganbacteria bacterium]|nr:DNA translocase FtsK 4TM domain-containing protein [Candidatus Saganbacteria bacterium]
MVRKRIETEGVSSQFKQDIIGILLLAFAIFVLASNFTSETGVVGLFLIKTFLLKGLGVGVYILPLFVAAIGIVIMIRQEVTQLTSRLTGLLLLFFAAITAFQFYSETYFAEEAALYSGGGGLVGLGLRTALERTLGVSGSYIILGAAFLISLLFIFNVTILHMATFVLSFLSKRGDASKKKKIIERDRATIPEMMPVIKEMTQPDRIEPDKLEPEIVPSKGRRKKLKGYELPPVDLLDLPTGKEKEKEEKLRETTELRKKILEKALASFGVAAKIVNINQGPVVTRFELQPEPGVKVSRIASLADDIALNLAAQGVRIEAPVPGKSVIGIEVPNSTVTPVRLGEIVRIPEFKRAAAKMFLALGEDLSGAPVFGDLSKMPHLLIAGTTGSGKSVCINSLIVSILLKATPDEVRFIMIDPKMVELTIYDGIPHLLAPVVTEPRRAALTLKEWVTREMDKRYKEFHRTAVRNIEAYNSRVAPSDILPYIVVIVDELADLMMVAPTEVEMTICRIAQMARATGIHLIIATQRPSVDVITGLIKANIPSRISFAVATQVDSRVILDMAGAEKLLGRGDMLYHPIGAMKSIRLQGSFVSDKETERVINFIKEQAEPDYVEEIVDLKPELSLAKSATGGRDELFGDAAKIIIEGGQASTSHLQRRLRIGYNRAARLMDEIEAEGLVSKSEGENKPRRILATRETLKKMGIE